MPNIIPVKNIEDINNKVTELDRWKSKDDKYPSVKAVYDAIQEVKDDVVDCVKNTDYAGYNTPGVVEILPGGTYGIDYLYGHVVQSGSNALAIKQATNEKIDAREDLYQPIVPANLDYAVKAALTDPRGEEWTEGQKRSARNVIDAVAKPKYGNSVPYFDDSCEETYALVNDDFSKAHAGHLPRYDNGGNLPVGNATEDYHAASKAYVTDALKSIVTYGTFVPKLGVRDITGEIIELNGDDYYNETYIDLSKGYSDGAYYKIGDMIFYNIEIKVAIKTLPYDLGRNHAYISLPDIYKPRT